MNVWNIPISVPFLLFYTGVKSRVSTIRITQKALYESHLFLGKKLSMETLKQNIGNIYVSTWWLLDRSLLGISLLTHWQVQCTAKSSKFRCAMDGERLQCHTPQTCWHFSSQKTGAGELRDVSNPVYWCSCVSTRWGCYSTYLFLEIHGHAPWSGNKGVTVSGLCCRL